MNETQSLTSFLGNIYTTADAEAVESAIDSVMPEFYQVTQKDIYKEFLNHLSVTLSNQFQRYFEQINTKTNDQLRSFLEALEQALHECELITLTVAFPLSYEMTEKAGKLLKEKFGTNTLIEMHVDAVIIAGAIITYKGKYIDYSLRTQLEKQQ